MSRRRINRHRNKLTPRMTKAERRAAIAPPKPGRWPDRCYEYKPTFDHLWQEIAWSYSSAEDYHERLWDDDYDDYDDCCCTGECQPDRISEWEKWWITQSA